MRQDGGVTSAESPRSYDTPVRVRWSDLDAFGHVNNARMLTLLEEARVDWLFVAARADGVDRLTDGIVVAEARIRYRRAITFGAHVIVSMHVSQLSSASFTVSYEVQSDGELAVQAETMLVPVDPTSFRPRRLDAAEKAYLAQFAGAGA